MCKHPSHKWQAIFSQAGSAPACRRHSQTPARRLRPAGKQTALARRTRLRRPPLICRRRGDEAHFNPSCRFSIRASSRRLLRHGGFHHWAVIALGGIPNKVQVGDMGVDGRIFPVSSSAAPRKQQEGELGLKEPWYPIQVKQKDKAGRPDIDAFEAMMMREDCEKSFFVSFAYTDHAMREADAFFRRSGKSIVLFTVQEILEEHLAKKLA